ncbi:interleukin-2 receptor subunit alpha isoform X2 [Marmota flaviventris]|uniref:interleukin-2 receptor subunit alpha isoform X2 n=1 Tax=Marmota flaviventris TaxID=93162 RepID=UPI000FFF6F2C|nr:interleukin-2 receptor subunit alpha isoform X2 [Marmota flaviventris]
MSLCSGTLPAPCEKAADRQPDPLERIASSLLSELVPSARKMEPSLLMWGLFTFIMVPGSMTEFCDNEPPEISYATFKALSFVNGTMLTCECKKGFRRIQNGSPYMLCTGNSFWENKCQCVSSHPRNTGKQVTPQPEEQKEGKTTKMQSQLQPVDQVNLAGHCQEPPAWEHEDTKRTYHFMVGQTLHYQCIQGYKTLHSGPFLSVCKTIRGGTRWTRPRLTCLDENELHLFTGEVDIQTSTNDLPESETYHTITTTDFQQHSEVATTMETFLFTMEYQIVVAGCVFLLISILLLSGLTWQRRWKKSRRTI